MATPQAPIYRIDASVTINLLGSENDGQILIETKPGHLSEEMLIILAMQALMDQVVEWYIPTPAAAGGRSNPGSGPGPARRR